MSILYTGGSAGRGTQCRYSVRSHDWCAPSWPTFSRRFLVSVRGRGVKYQSRGRGRPVGGRSLYYNLYIIRVHGVPKSTIARWFVFLCKNWHPIRGSAWYFNLSKYFRCCTPGGGGKVWERTHVPIPGATGKISGAHTYQRKRAPGGGRGGTLLHPVQTLYWLHARHPLLPEGSPNFKIWAPRGPPDALHWSTYLDEFLPLL